MDKIIYYIKLRLSGCISLICIFFLCATILVNKDVYNSVADHKIP